MMIKQIRNSKFVIRNCQKGMTYVELIVVLSIFSIMTSITIFNYNKFEAKVDVKILANDIASKIVEAQKSAMSGKWNPSASLNWKPSYGINFDLTDKTHFIYFANIGGVGDNIFDSADPVLDEIGITKNNFIKDLKCSGTSISELDIVFRRPDSKALINSEIGSCSGDVEIIISSPQAVDSTIKVSPSGRIQIN